MTAAFVAAALCVAGCGGSKNTGPRGKAREALADDKPDRAAKILLPILTRDPENPELAPVYNDLGVVYQRLGQEEEAIVAFENSRQLDALLPGPAYNLGVLLYQRGDVERAQALFQEAAPLDPEDPRPLEFSATIEMDANRWTEAEDLLVQALARAPESPRVLTALGLARSHTEGASKAMISLLEAIELDPEYGPAYFNLAKVHQDQLDDPEGAVRYLDRFLETSPDAPRAAQAREMAKALRSPGSRTAPDPSPSPARPTDPPVRADPESEPGHEAVSDPGSPDPEPVVQDPPRERRTAPIPSRPRTVDGLLALAREQAGRGDTALAYRTGREARARAEQQGDEAAAERVLLTILSLCGDQAGAHYDHGRYLMSQHQHEAALRSFKQAVGLAPEWVPAYLGMADTALRTGQNEAARIALARALRADPGNREAIWGLAGLYDQRLNQPAEAIEFYRAFLTLYDSDSRAQAARARIAALRARLADPSEPESPEPETPEPEPETPEPDAPAPDSDPPAPEPEVEIADPTPPPAETAPTELEINRPQVRNKKAAIEAYNRGTMYQSRQNWDQAVFFYRRSIEQDDTFALAYYNLGKVYETQGEDALAIQAYEGSIRLQPRHINSRFNLAILHRKQGDSDRALAQLRGILRIEPSHARTHYLIGLIYSEDPATREEATRYLKRFLSLSPEDRAAPAVRDWLQATP